jgi:hypothetical protein
MNERIEMWKASDASRQTVTPQHVEMLKTKYEGKVPTGIVGGKATESIKNLENFLEEWFPYGKPLQEMEEILGVKLPVKDDEAVLVIDHGLWGQAFRFLLRQGKIRAVKKRGLN